MFLNTTYKGVVRYPEFYGFFLAKQSKSTLFKLKNSRFSSTIPDHPIKITLPASSCKWRSQVAEKKSGSQKEGLCSQYHLKVTCKLQTKCFICGNTKENSKYNFVE